MSLRTLALAGLLLGAIGWWYSPLSPRVPAAPAPIAGVEGACPLPAGADPAHGPVQGGLPPGLAPFRLQAGTLVELVPHTPLDVPLHWQQARAGSALLEGLTRCVMAAARGALVG